jgi:hypothetical protein
LTCRLLCLFLPVTNEHGKMFPRAIHIEVDISETFRYRLFPLQTCTPNCFSRGSIVPFETIRADDFLKCCLVSSTALSNNTDKNLHMREIDITY